MSSKHNAGAGTEFGTQRSFHARLVEMRGSSSLFFLHAVSSRPQIPPQYIQQATPQEVYVTHHDTGVPVSTALLLIIIPAGGHWQTANRRYLLSATISLATVDPATGRHIPIELSIPQARGAIEDEINFYSAHILRLKTTFNALAPVSRLPLETLYTIFSLATGMYSCDASSGAAPIGGMISVSHVCKHWRNVALSCPTLWSAINFNTLIPECIPEFLSRSQEAPLAISWVIKDSYSPHYPTGGDDADNDSSLALVLRNQLWRVRSLSLVLRFNREDMVLRRLNVPAPLLESLNIHCTKLTELSSEAYEVVHQSLVSGKLRRLELTCVPMTWSQVSLPHLTHLSITGRLHFDAHYRTNVGLLLDAISRMPMLESLAIQVALAHPSMDASTESTQMTLPHLRSLRLTEHVFNCIRIFDAMVVPSLNHLCMDVQGNEDIVTVAQRLASAVAAKAGSSYTFGTVTVDFGLHMTGGRLCAYGDVYDIATAYKLFRAEDKTCLPALNVRFGDLEDRGTDLHAILCEICRLLPLDSVRTLLVGGSKILPAFWAVLLPKAHNVESLLISDSGMNSELTFPEMLTPSLSRLEGEDDRGHEQPSVLPRLAQLALATCDFCNLDFGDWPNFATTEETLLTRLLGCLTARAEEGMGIKNLYLFHTINLSQRDVDILKNSVDHLEWDHGAVHESGPRNSILGGLHVWSLDDIAVDGHWGTEEELDGYEQWEAEETMGSPEAWVDEDYHDEAEGEWSGSSE